MPFKLLPTDDDFADALRDTIQNLFEMKSPECVTEELNHPEYSRNINIWKGYTTDYNEHKKANGTKGKLFNKY